MIHRIPRLAAATLAAALTLGMASPAFAEDGQDTEPETPLAERCLDQIDRRLGDLATAKNRAASASALTDSHLSSINTIIDSTTAGLNELADEIATTEDRGLLVQHCAAIATDFRVYLVVLPQTHLAIGADRAEAASARGDELIAIFDAAVDAAIDAGADVAEAVALRDAAAAHVAAAAAATDGVGDQVLTVTPSAWNDGSGEVVIQDSRTAVRSGHDEIKQGIDDGKAAIDALRLALDAVGSDA